ncbi:MAG: hypothetical protein ACOX6H_00080 [Christensenellales bacterium]|jgi:hypothetical protein
MVSEKMYKSKKVVLTLLMTLLVLFSGILAACGDQTKNLVFTASKNEVEIFLGKTENNLEKVVIQAKGASEDILSDIYISVENQNISIYKQTYLGNGKTELTIKAITKGTSYVTVSSKQNINKKTMFTVKVIEPVRQILAKQSNFKNFVLRGGQTVVDNSLVEFVPEHTDQKNVTFEIENNPAPEFITLQNGVLRVAEGTPVSIKTISVKAMSDQEDVNSVSLTFDILTPITKEMYTLTNSLEQTLQKEENNFARVYVATNAPATGPGSSFANETVKIQLDKLNIDKDVTISYVLEDSSLTTDFVQVVSTNYKKADKYLSVDLKAAKQSGLSRLYFKISYDGYNYSYSTEENRVEILSYDIIENIYINNQMAEDAQTYTLFTNYALEEGLSLKFGISPSTVAEEYKTFFLKTTDYSPETPNENNINIYVRQSASRLVLLALNSDGELEVKENQEIFIVANASKNVSDAQIIVETRFGAKYYNNGENKKEAIINFSVKKGVSQAEFVGFENPENANTYFDSSKVETQRLYFKVYPADAEVANFISFTNGDNIIVNKNTLREEEVADEFKIYSVQVSSKANNEVATSILGISFGNGRAISLKVHTLVPFKANVQISSVASNQSSSVGEYVVNKLPGIDFKLAIKNGSTVSFLTNLLKNTYNVEFSFIDYDIKLADEDIELVSYADNTGVIRATDLKSFGLITALKVGKVLVRASFGGQVFQMSENGMYQELRSTTQEESVVKFFLVEVYEPVTSFEISSGALDLYSLETVGFYNKAYAQATLKLSVNFGKTPATYSEILQTSNNLAVSTSINDKNVHVSVHKQEGKEGEYLVTALRTSTDPETVIDKYTGGQILFQIREFNKVITLKVEMTIRSAVKVSSVEVYNVNEENGIYLNVNKNEDRSFFIAAAAGNQNAFNKKLKYFFEPDTGTNSNILSIDENTGLINLNTELKTGGTGIIKIIPQDAFIINSLNQPEIIQDNKVYKTFKIIVADGKSQSTSFRIESLEEIEDFTAHYTLKNDVVVPANWEAKDFSGGLYGKEEGTTEKHVINFTNNNLTPLKTTLFASLSQNAIVKDLIIVGEIEVANGGFVALTNSGTITGVIVDTFLKGGKYAPSKIQMISGGETIGGLVGTNNATGKILNSAFFGLINASTGFVGGIAAYNNGEINGAAVEFYRYENDNTDNEVYGGILTSNSIVGGISAVTSGVILNSYVYSYHNKTALSGVAVGAIAYNALSNARFEKVFARINGINALASVLLVSQYNGSVLAYTGTLSLNIKNSYILTYLPDQANSEIYSFINDNKQYYSNGLSLFNADRQTVIRFYSDRGVVISTSSPWAIGFENNGGYPYLKEIKNDEVDSQIIYDLGFINSENVLVSENKLNAIFFMYEPLSSVGLTTAESAQIKAWNTLGFQTLFGTSSKNIKVKIANGSNSASVNSNSLEMLKTGELTLDVFLKYDFSARKTVQVYIIHKINEVGLLYNGEALGLNPQITVKKGTTQVISTDVSVTRVVTDRLIEFKQNNNLKIVLEPINSAEDIVSSTNSSIFSIDTSKIDGLVNFRAYPLILDANETYNYILFSKLIKSFSIKTYTGAFSIETNIKDIVRIQPKDVITVNVEVLTDAPNELLDVKVFDQTSSLTFTFRGRTYAYEEMFVGDSKQLVLNLVRQTTEGDKTRNFYTLKLEIADEFKDYNFNGLKLSFEISPVEHPNVFGVFNVEIDSQVIEFVGVRSREFNYFYMTEGYVFKSEPTNLITPGKSALLSIDLFPAYAYYDSLEITSDVVDGNSVLLDLMKFENAKFFKATTGFRAVENGIAISKSSLQAMEQIAQSNLANLYIFASIPQNVKKDVVFTITIKAYDSNKEELFSTNYILSTQALQSAEIKINGKESEVVARGTSATLEVKVAADQTLDSLTISPNDGDSGAIITGIEFGGVTETVDNALNTKTYTISLYVSELARFISATSPTFRVVAKVKREIGNVQEVATSEVKVTVVDFLIDKESFRLKTDSFNTNVLNIYIGISKLLEFDFDTTEWRDYSATMPEFNEAVSALRAQVEKFRKYNYLYNVEPANSTLPYILNYHEGDTNSYVYKNFLNNLYYVNANGSTTKVLSANGQVIKSGIVDFDFIDDGASTPASSVSEGASAPNTLSVIGARTGQQKMRLLFTYKTPDGMVREFTYDFTINVTAYTDEDNPTQIHTAQEFLDIQNQDVSQDYILMENIELYNYVPFDTSKIKSFDGNNKVISIMSFDLMEEQEVSSLSLALFRNVTSSTTIKNVIVNYYHLNTITINTAKFKTINIAGFAIENNGIITNSHVLAYKMNNLMPNVANPTPGIYVLYATGTTGTSIPSNVTSNIAGFVLNNNGSGYITNSRVGGTEFKVVQNSYLQTITNPLQIFTLSAQGNINGFVGTNSGFIASSFTNNIEIQNATTVGRQTTTAGFAGTNTGKISLSYSKGAYNTRYPNEIRTTGSGISTSSVGAGFVFLNTGEISDSYSNIMIKDRAGNAGSYSAGFVYNNQGLIQRTFSSSVIENSKSTQMSFTGVDSHSNLLNTGTITNSYYYAPLNTTTGSGDTEELYDSGALRVDSLTNTELFYGFSFANANTKDGVWFMTTSKGIDLISANDIAISSRHVEGQGNANLVYADGYAYGSSSNPILIRNAKEFNDVFGLSKSTPIQQYFNLEQKAVFGNYRILANINLYDLTSSQGEDYKLSSSEMRLTNAAIVDGNNFTISNIELVSSVNNTQKFYGMFAYLEKNSIIKNLNIGLLGINASNITHVGAVAGAINNSKIVNINLFAQNNSQTALVLGQNIVGGIVGLVTGNSEIISLTTTNVSVTADFFNKTSFERQTYIRKENLALMNNQTLSYAGGIAGVVDIFTEDKLGQKFYFKDRVMSYSASANLKVFGMNQIRAATVGGVLGYSGLNTFLRDLSYEVVANTQTATQKIISYKYAAGGLVGELFGNLTQSKIEHTAVLQKTIENNIANYYNTNLTFTRGNETLFIEANADYEPLFVGGLVGQVFSGELSNSYAKVNVIGTNARFVGGLIGAIGDFKVDTEYRNLKPIGTVLIQELYHFGDLKSASSKEKIVGVQEEFAAGAGGAFGFVEFVAPSTFNDYEEVFIIIDGLNTITYLNKTQPTILGANNKIETKDIYDLYAYTYDTKAKQFIASINYSAHSVARTSDSPNSLISDLFMIPETYNGLLTPKIYTTNYFIKANENYYLQKSIIGGTQNDPKTITDKVVPLNEIRDVAVDAVQMDIIFRNNDWDENNWERKTGNLLPSIVFTVSSSIIYIRTAADFALMATYPDKTFIIIAGGPDSQNKIIDLSSLTDETFKQIQSFSGVLKGYTPENEELVGKPVPEYGFSGYALKEALIGIATNGAVFSDFVIQDSGYHNDIDIMKGSALLVEQSSVAIFKNIIINNSRIVTESRNAALLVGHAINSTFENLEVNYTTTKKIMMQYVTSQAVNKDANFYAGLITAKATSDIKTTFKNIKINVNNRNGINIDGSSITANDPSVSIVKNINVGGIIGAVVQGSVEFSRDTLGFTNRGPAAIIQNLFISLTGSSLESDYYTLKAGGLAGFVGNASIMLLEPAKEVATTVSFDFAAKFKAGDNNAASSASIGGLFGFAGGNVHTAFTENTKLNIKPSVAFQNQLPTQTENYSNVHIGGVVGNVKGLLKIDNVVVGKGEESDDLRSIPTSFDIRANQNNLYVGGIAGEANNTVTISSNLVGKLFNPKISNNSTNSGSAFVRFGGIIGSLNSSSNESNIFKNNTNQVVKIENSKQVDAGGLVGYLDVLDAKVNDLTPSYSLKTIDGRTTTDRTGNIVNTSFDIVRHDNSSINAGGLIGRIKVPTNVETSSSTIYSKQVLLEGNIAFGDINLIYQPLASVAETKSSYIGGLVGTSSNNTLVKNNKILTTLYTNRINEKVWLDAVAGNKTLSAANTEQGSNNYYSSQINLTTHSSLFLTSEKIFAENLTYEELLNEMGESLIRTILSAENSLFAVDGDGKLVKNGHKLNPYEINSSSEFSSTSLSARTLRKDFRTYFTLGDIQTFNQPAIKLGETSISNIAIIGNGKQIQLKNTEKRVFNEIDEKSFISGLNLTLDIEQNYVYPEGYSGYLYKYGQSVYSYPFTIYGALSAVNHGVIYASAVKGKEYVSQDFATYSNEFYAKLLITNTNLVGGIVGLNKGFIADSLTNIEINNITDVKTTSNTAINNNLFVEQDFADFIQINGSSFTIRPITSGFVGINEGDIKTSISSGYIKTPFGIAYSFGADNQNVAFLNNNNAGPSVRNSFAYTNAVNAFNKESETKALTSLNNVFGYSANDTNAYDIYATGVESKAGTAQKLITKQLFSMQPSVNTNFEFKVNYNFGYLTFGRNYNSSSFDYMRVLTSIDKDYLISNLGILKQKDDLLQISVNKNVYLTNDIIITDAMGRFDDGDTFSALDEQSSWNWNSMSLNKLKLFGNDFTISGFRVLSNQENQKTNNGFFSTINETEIHNLTLANGQVVMDNPDKFGTGVVGAFAGLATNSLIENSKNLGVSVVSNYYGYAGGIVGKLNGGSIKSTINTGNVIVRLINPSLSENDATINAGGIAATFLNVSSSNDIYGNENYGFVYSSHIENENAELLENNTYGIGYRPSQNSQAANYNHGLVRKEFVTENNEIVVDESVYTLFNKTLQDVKQTPSNRALPQDVTTLQGNGTKEKPYLIYNLAELKTALSRYRNEVTSTFSIILMNNIDISDYYNSSMVKMFIDSFDGIIYGNNKLLSYKFNSDTIKQFLINSVSADSTITNLNVLGTISKSYYYNSLFVNKNYGLLQNINVYGSIIKNGELLNEDVTDSKNNLSGLAINNFAKIKSVNNFAVITSNDGQNARYQDIESIIHRTNSISASKIGGIVAINNENAEIIDGNNFGALIAGNGGQGYGRDNALLDKLIQQSDIDTKTGGLYLTQEEKTFIKYFYTVVAYTDSEIYEVENEQYLGIGRTDANNDESEGLTTLENLGQTFINLYNEYVERFINNPSLLYKFKLITIVNGYYRFDSTELVRDIYKYFYNKGFYSSEAMNLYQTLLNNIYLKYKQKSIQLYKDPLPLDRLMIIWRYAALSDYIDELVADDGTTSYETVGIIGKKLYSISINSPTIVDGGGGLNAVDSPDTDYGLPGENGKDGLPGGNASIIGGVASKSISSESYVTGNNFGIIIGGHGGTGGDGGYGGDGGHGNREKASIEFFKFFDRLSELKNDRFHGGNGGNGGDGGNGGSSIIAHYIGIGNSKIAQSNAKSLIQPIAIAGLEGRGGYGGKGGIGGHGVLGKSLAELDFQNVNPWFALYDAVYSFGGHGGTGGNAGFNGNSYELLDVALELYSFDDISLQNSDLRKGKASYFTYKNLGNIKIIYQTALLFYNDYYTTPGGIGGSPYEIEKVTTVPNVGGSKVNVDANGNFIINDWSDLRRAIFINNTYQNDNVIYYLTRDFRFAKTPSGHAKPEDYAADVYEPLPSFYGTINGKISDTRNAKIIINGSYPSLSLLSGRGKIENLNIRLAIDNYSEKFDSINQILFNNKGTDNHQSGINFDAGSTISYNQTKDQYILINSDENGQAQLPSATNITFNFISSTFSSVNAQGLLLPDNNEIKTKAQFAEFVLLANLGSDKDFILDYDISIPVENMTENKTVINVFNGSLRSMTSKKITLQNSVDEEQSVLYKSFIFDNRGTITGIGFDGFFSLSGVAINNNGLIDNVRIGSASDVKTIIANDEIYGISVNNNGTISNVLNFYNLTSKSGNAAGIVGVNQRLITGAKNFGDIKAGKETQENDGIIIEATKGGDAAGIAIYNGSNDSSSPAYDENGNLLRGITKSENTGNITAGNGATGQPGGNAAGIVVYNFYTEDYVDEDGDPQINIYYGVLMSFESNRLNMGLISNTGEIIAGNGSNGENGGSAGLIIAVNSITIEGNTIEGYYNNEEAEDAFYNQGGTVVLGLPNGTLFTLTIIPIPEE